MDNRTSTPNPAETLADDPRARAQAALLVAALATAKRAHHVVAEAASLELGRQVANQIATRLGPEAAQKAVGTVLGVAQSLVESQLPASAVRHLNLSTLAPELLAAPALTGTAARSALVAGEQGAMVGTALASATANLGRAALGATLRSSAVGAGVGALVNGSVAAWRVSKGQSTVQEAARDFALDTGKDGVAAAISTGATLAAAAVLGTAALPVLAVGAAVGVGARLAMGTSTGRRVAPAAPCVD